VPDDNNLTSIRNLPGILPAGSGAFLGFPGSRFPEIATIFRNGGRPGKRRGNHIRLLGVDMPCSLSLFRSDKIRLPPPGR
jgi:hypothetical protein